MAATLDPISSPQAWDTITIGGIVSPGICHVSEFKRAAEWDQKRGKGARGATLTYVGQPAAKGSIEFELWTSAHFAAWDMFMPLFKYDPARKAVSGVDIYDPSLALIDITSVVTEEVGNPVHKGGQLYTITVSFIEYFPVTKASAVSTANGSKASPVGGVRAFPSGNVVPPGVPPPSVDDAALQSIADLTGAAQKPLG